MNWIPLTSEAQLKEIREKSKTTGQVIFKHSTRCPTSSVAKNRLEKNQAPSNTDFYYLDLISYRSISNKIAEEFMVHHESPQILIIKNGDCIFEESHLGIDMAEIAKQVA